MSTPPWLLDLVREGSRCLICAAVNPTSDEDIQCKNCTSDDSSLEYVRTFCVYLRQRFFEYMLQTNNGAPPLDPSLPAAEARRLQMCQVLKKCCVKSQFYLWSDLKQHLVDNQDCSVTQVCEVTIKTKQQRDGNRWMHALFLLHLTINGQPRAIAYDPTGCQFGPDWPLLQDFREYKRLRADETASANTEIYGAGTAYIRHHMDQEELRRYSEELIRVGD